MSASLENVSSRHSPTKSSAKLVRVIATPEYIPTLGGSDIQMAQVVASSNVVAKTTQWGRIRNVAEIRGNLASSDSENDTNDTGDNTERQKRYGAEDFHKAAKLLLKSKKVIERVRERYSAKGMRYLRSLPRQQTRDSLDNYNLKQMHTNTRRRRHLKLAMLQKQFIDELPTLRDQSIRAHLARKIQVLEKIKSSSHVLQDTKLMNELVDEMGRPFTDHPTRRQSRLRRSIDVSIPPVKLLETHKDTELSVSDVDHLLAIAKSREKIETELDLPEDRVARLTRLRHNVNKINVKFQSLLNDRKGDGEKDANNDDDEKPYYAPSRFVKTGMALHLFRKYSRIVLIVLQWINMIMHKRFDFEKELKSFVDIANEIEDQTVSSTMHEMGLSFDKKFFKANREISLSSDARKILTTRPLSRTPQMIKQVMNGLQSLRSLSEYPIQTQEKLCRVAWYQTIGPKKLIIRQGHHAESFYFILSGAAFVKKMVQDPVTGENKAQVAARLTRGHSFGEIGLLFDTLRTATVESSTPMELLVIGKEDFVHIFMKAENPDDEADHIKFLRTVSFMRHWPIDALKLEPGACLTHYFKRGTLITDNDRHSEWIYFVMNGTCVSLKKLKAVKPRSPSESRPRTANPLSAIILPELGITSNGPKIDSGKARGKHKSSINSELFDEMTSYYDSIRQKHIASLPKPPVRTAADDDAETEFNLPQSSDLQLPKIFMRSSSARTFSDNETSTKVKFLERKEKTEGDLEMRIKFAPVQVEEDSSRPVSRAKFSEATPKMKTVNFYVPTPDNLKALYRPESKGGKKGDIIQPEAQDDVFIKVESLHVHDTFGLNTLKYVMDADDEVFDVEGDNESPILALVSGGAEVVMLSKKVFLKYSDQKCRMHVRDKIRVYPTETVMQSNMQLEADWNQYKTQIMEQCLLRKSSRASK